MGQKDYRQIILRIAASEDGFEWNPYSETRVNRTANRLRKKRLLKVDRKISPSRIVLRLPQ